MEQLSLFSAQPEPSPPPRRREPALWIARLILLRAPRLDEDAVLREIRLRRGLNILWAPPSPPAGGNRLREGRLSGHTAGKTTLCRMVRYLLGEERFGVARTQDRIRIRLPEGLVIGEIVVRGERWIVGRPFARGLHPFASRGASIEEALAARGPYQDFLAAVSAATAELLPVRSLPHARRPIDWPMLLTWVARDQEARFGGVVEFRHPGSESASPSPTLADRHLALRAALELVSDEEREIAEEQELCADRRKRLEGEAALLRRRADEDRRRLTALLGLGPDDGEAGPLFAVRLSERVAARRAALDADEAGLAPIEAAAAEALEAATRAAGELAVLAERRRELTGGVATGLGAPSAGRCNVPLRLAVDRGCPLAAAEAESAADREREAAAVEGAWVEADAAHRALREAYLRQNAALQARRAEIARGRAALAEAERLHGYAGASAGDVEANEAALAGAEREAEALSKRKARRRRQHGEAEERLSTRFHDVIQALLGRDVSGRAEVRGGEIDLAIIEHGERDGAAMETLKVLAFDLASLTLSAEGHGHFPGLLIHDGPREADLDELIYERLFLYAEELEGRFTDEPPFQYLVTTTAPPPERLRQAPWLIEPRLDASTPEGRLLRMDL